MRESRGVAFLIGEVIRLAVEGRKAVLGLAGVLLAGGIWAWSTIPFEPFPDLTANSVSVIADAPGMAPQDVEQLVTFPIERSLLGLPRTESVRSTTKFGVSITQVSPTRWCIWECVVVCLPASQYLLILPTLRPRSQSM